MIGNQLNDLWYIYRIENWIVIKYDIGEEYLIMEKNNY